MASGQQPNSTGTGWKVTGQTETTELGPGGKAERGKRLTWSSSDGLTGSVFVPDSLGDLESVKAQVSDAVARARSLQGLTG